MYLIVSHTVAAYYGAGLGTSNLNRSTELCHKSAVSKRFSQPNTLPEWLRTGLGESLIRAEHESVQKMLAGLFGPVAVQIGDAGFGSFVDASEAAFCYNAGIEPQRRDDPEHDNKKTSNLYCVPEQLPFEARSIGLVVLPHVLEFSDYPHQILREAERVLVPEGHLVVLGFNPVSAWGVARLLRGNRMPWNGNFASLARLKDWLKLLNFELTAGRMIYHKPPVQSDRVRRWLGFLENAGDRWWPLGAAVYVVVARKHEIGVTPLHPEWKKQSRLNPGLAKPVANARYHAYYEEYDEAQTG